MSGLLHKISDALKPLPSHKGDDHHDHHDAREDRNERQAYSVSGAHGSTGLEAEEALRHHKHGQNEGTTPAIKTLASEEKRIYGYSTGHGAKDDAKAQTLTDAVHTSQEPAVSHHGAEAGLGTAAAGTGATAVGAEALHSREDNDSAGGGVKTLASEEQRIYGYSTGKGAKQDIKAQDLASTDLTSQEPGGAPQSRTGTHGTTNSRYDDPTTTSTYDRATTGDQTHSSGITGGTALGAAGLGAAGATTSTSGQHASGHDNDSYGTTSTGRARDETTAYAAGTGTEPSYATAGTHDTYGGITDTGTGTSGTAGTSSLPTRTRDEHGTPIISSSQRGYGSGGSDPRFSSAGTYHDTSTSNDTSKTTAPHSSSLLNKLDPRVKSGADTTSFSSTYQTPGAFPSDSSTTNPSTEQNFFHCMHCGHKNDASQLQSPDGGAYKSETGFLHCTSCGHRNGVSGLFS